MHYPLFKNIKIVLVGTTHPGNIGAAARAMKTMGMHRLALVNPKIFPSADATARAAGADDILSNAAVYGSLAAAVGDCVLVYGTSARTRYLPCPVSGPGPACAELVDRAGQNPVAVVFGRESSGLSNEELDVCNKMIVIPGDPNFSSLNLAAAVQIICYELYRSAADRSPVNAAGTDTSAVVTAEDMQHLYTHLQQCLVQTGFLDLEKPRNLMRRLTRFFNRTQMDRNEYNIFRGILTAVEEALRKISG